MGGEVLNMPEPNGPVSVGNTGGFDGRIEQLETRMTAVELSLKETLINSAIAADNTAELLAIANATKTFAGFIRKHGPKILSYGCGIMTVLGIGNAPMLHTIERFFGY